MPYEGRVKNNVIHSVGNAGRRVRGMLTPAISKLMMWGGRVGPNFKQQG